MRILAWLVSALLIGCGGCQPSDDGGGGGDGGEGGAGGAGAAGGAGGASGNLGSAVEALRAQYDVSAVAVGRLEGGRLVRSGAAGQADPEAGVPARTHTIFALASVSKVVVGVAIARAIELGHDLDLDADVNEYLEWSPPLRHPQFPNQPITLRQLARHRSGLESDGPADIENYPRPDPDQALEPFLKSLLAQPDMWTSNAPDAAEEYSNLGTALAALVVQAVVDEPFEDFCRKEIFDRVGMPDTRWFYRELSSEQRARTAVPQGEDGPYGHYGFNDWPSGQLRSTVADLAKLMGVLAQGGGSLLSARTQSLFETVPLFVGTEEAPTFDHSGGEAGVNTYIAWRKDGSGLVVLVSDDMDEDDFGALISAAERL